MNQLDFKVDNSHWIWMVYDNEKTYSGIEVSSQYILHSNEGKLFKDSYVNGNIDPFIDSNEIVMKLRRKQVLGQQRIRPLQVMLKKSKIIYKYYGSDSNINETSEVHLNNEGQNMLLEPMGPDDENNVESSLFLNTRQLVTEYEIWGTYDYMKDVGSYLALIFILVLVIFTIVGSFFVAAFVKQFKLLVARKYQEASCMHQMKRYLKKFDQIY